MTDTTILEMFGLTYEQTLLLFSTEKMLTLWDINSTKDEKGRKIKQQWLNDWEKGIKSYLDDIDGKVRHCDLLDDSVLHDCYIKALEGENNLTWYYIIILELITFVPYTPLGGDTDKDFKKCKHDGKLCFNKLKKYVVEHHRVTGPKMEELKKTYCDSLSKTSGRKSNIIHKILISVAFSALAAALAAVFAGPIAVAIFGGSFPALHGVALTNACLAMLGGGAIAVGGAGVAGGAAVMAGGGALLGLAAGSGTAVGLVNLLTSSPDFTLSQTAKLQTILKSVILIEEKDVVTAQKIIAQYKEQIGEIAKKYTILELEREQDKKEMENIKECLNYMKSSCVDMRDYTDSFNPGA